MISETDKAWIAGVLESRARISTRVKPTQVYLRIMLQAKDESVSRQVLNMCGRNSTKIMRRKAYDRHTCIEHCEDPHQHIREGTTLRCDMTGVRAVVVCHNVIPYMRARQGEFSDALSYAIANPPKAGGKAHARAAMNSMTGLGWCIPDAIKGWGDNK